MDRKLRKLLSCEELYEKYDEIHARCEAQRRAATGRHGRVAKILSGRRVEIVKDQRLVAMIEAIERGQPRAKIPAIPMR